MLIILLTALYRHTFVPSLSSTLDSWSNPNPGLRRTPQTPRTFQTRGPAKALTLGLGLWVGVGIGVGVGVGVGIVVGVVVGG